MRETGCETFGYVEGWVAWMREMDNLDERRVGRRVIMWREMGGLDVMRWIALKREMCG
jgi:hypothetical protein